MGNINLKNINKETIIGFSLLILALVNMVLQVFGYNTIPITDAELSGVLSSVFVIITALYNTYKNRNVTTPAQKGQEITDLIKSGVVLVEDVDALIDKCKVQYRK